MTDARDTLAALDRIGELLKQPTPAQQQQQQPSGELHEVLAEQLAAHQSRWLTWGDLRGGQDAA
jgi:hypothetical protein